MNANKINADNDNYGKKEKKIEIEKENIGENVDDKKLKNLSGNSQNNKLKKKNSRDLSRQ